jgi:hypothetical protein
MSDPPSEHRAPYADNAIVARLLRTGMDDRKLRAIGVITLIWNSIEFDFQELVWVIAHWSPWDGSLVTADMGNVSRIQLALNMLHRKITDDRLKSEASVIIDYFDACRVMRNRLVHGVPVYDDNGKISGRIAHFEARRGTGEISIKHIEVTQAYLVLLLADLLTCAEGIADIARKIHNLRQYERDAQIQKDFTFEGFVFEYRAPSFDIDGVRSRLKSLRSQPPVPDKNPPQLQPSPG